MSSSSDFLKKQAHDLRSPISVLKGYLEFKSEDSLSEDEQAYVEALKMCAERLTRIADTLDTQARGEVVPMAVVTQLQIAPQPELKGEGILIVDDDPSLRLQWRLFFKKRAVPTIEAASGEELLGRHLDYSTIRRAIVDYNFEGSALNGFDIIEYLQQKGVEQIHLCTGQHAEENVQIRARSLGVASVIPKPIDTKTCDGVFGT